VFLIPCSHFPGPFRPLYTTCAHRRHANPSICQDVEMLPVPIQDGDSAISININVNLPTDITSATSSITVCRSLTTPRAGLLVLSN
jgi:hypothetical protein